MTKKQFRTRLRLLIILSLLLLGMIGFVVGKYITTIEKKGRVTFTAKLAEAVILQEHTAQRQADGSYNLVEPFVTENTYYLIPGLDIPKDPHIVIEEKTPIPAYLFVEVVDKLDTNLVEGETKKPVSYSMATGWTELEGITGADGSKVYYYNAVIDQDFSAYPIYILKDNKVTVSQYLRCQTADDGEDILKFNVKLVEKVGEETAAQAYDGYQ